MQESYGVACVKCHNGNDDPKQGISAPCVVEKAVCDCEHTEQSGAKLIYECCNLNARYYQSESNNEKHGADSVDSQHGERYDYLTASAMTSDAITLTALTMVEMTDSL